MAKRTHLLNIKVYEIDKSAFYHGRHGERMNVVLIENDAPDQYGNDGFIVQQLPKDRYEAGEQGPIIGNWKHVRSVPHADQRVRQNKPEKHDEEDSDIPF